MARQSRSENDAYAKLQKTAMDKYLRLANVAQRLLDVADLLGHKNKSVVIYCLFFDFSNL
jgi:hypothetical protein